MPNAVAEGRPQSVSDNHSFSVYDSLLGTLIVAICICGCSTPDENDWKSLGVADDSTTLKLNLASIRDEGPRLYSAEVDFGFSTATHLFDCILNRIAFRSITIVDSTDQPKTSTFEKQIWIPPTPGTAVSLALEEVCGESAALARPGDGVRWLLLDSNDDFEMFLDLQGTETPTDTMRVWWKLVAKDTTPSREFVEAKLQVELLCSGGMYRSTAEVTYDTSGAAVSNTQPFADWEPVIPETRMEYLTRRVCW